MTLFRGSGVALITPFDSNGINYEKLEELIYWHIERKTDAIIICGTTGETPTMTKDEKKKIIKFTVDKVKGRIPVIAGTGSNNTKETVDLSKHAQKVGADGLLLVTPYYNKTTQRGLIQHYRFIADRVDIPIVLYNVPGRTGLNMLPETVAELAKHPNIQGLKEASGDISQVAEIGRLCPEDFDIYSGNDDQIVPILSLGGKGVISVVANILPEETHNLVISYLDGEVIKSRDLQLSLNGLINSLFIETNPIPIKEAMNILGMEVGEVRLPLVKMETINRNILIDNLEELGLSTGRE
ncbi:4-hydroxy-tetrahydrodipicolinate synthase [Dethiothermospora halolimnae]|uniref:4-hydroxy-tetrahydrodipicolinate synthase n=1 Tax=Dethiothermospora halolimnae TaxID=3114390 RepID=UPI003CCB854B